MTLNHIETETYEGQPEAPENVESAPSQHKLPRLFWAAVACFSINLTIASAVWFSPKLRVDMYGAVRDDQERVVAVAKPSPFTEVVKTKVAKVRRPERLTPVVFEATVPVRAHTFTEAEAQPASYSYTSSTRAYDTAEKARAYPRVTAAVRAVSLNLSN